MTLAPLREAADSLVKASTPQPFSASRTSNWVARLGGLPDYIQHVAHGILRSDPKGGESGAIAKAVGVVKRWAAGGGKVDKNTQAAAAKAVAEWEKLKARAKVKESWVSRADAYRASVADEAVVERDAFGRLVVFERTLGLDGMVGLLAGGLLEAAQAWNPTLKPAIKADAELERLHVYDGAQHVGTIARRAGMPSESDRWTVRTVNGNRLGGYAGVKSKSDALEALRAHLSSAPARVISLPSAGQFLVASPSEWGETSYRAFPSEGAARHAAGLPAQPTVPETQSRVEGLAEMLRFDLMSVSGRDAAPLREVQRARRMDPLELVEAFHADERRGAHGRWVGRGVTSRIAARSGGPGLAAPVANLAVPNKYRPRSRGPADTRYEGGVTRESAKLRAAHAAKPQIAKATDHEPEKALAAAVRSGSWDKSSADVSRRLLAQPEMGMADIERKVKSGEAIDTETAHRTGPGGTYSAERKALHEHIINLLLQGKGVHERKARAIFTAGGGASGKSAMIAAGAVNVPHDAVIANADVIREMLPEYKALKAAGREDAASLTHEEASHITKVVTRLALGRRHHLLVDGVGNSGPGKFAGKVQDAIRAGHSTSVHYATIPTQDAIARADDRGRRKGRYVDHGVLRAAHKSVSANFPSIAGIRSAHVQVFSTANGPNGERLPPRLMLDKAHGSDKLVIRDPSGVQGFRDKANE